MNLIARARSAIAKAVAPRGARSWTESGRWNVIHDPFPGAWQQDIDVSEDSVKLFSAVYACVDLISSDIAKLRPRVVQKTDGVWLEVDANSRPLVRSPNRYQTRIQFLQEWMQSKLYSGSAYILIQRGENGSPESLYVLNPARVDVMVTQDGAVYYRIGQHWLAGLTDEDIYIPASEIIHDRCMTINHPLIGVSPLVSSFASASLGMRISKTGSNFFSKSALPSGVLTAPGKIDPVTAKRLKDTWETKFSGENAGSIAVLGDDLKFTPLTMSAAEAQQLGQMEWAIGDVARTYHVPAHKLGAGAPPTFNNISALNQDYYQQALQRHIEDIEVLLDQAFGFGPGIGWDLDLEGLLRMDPVTRSTVNKEGIAGGWLKPNEARASEGRAPVEGGDTPYMQQQNWPLAELTGRPEPGAQPAPPSHEDVDEESEAAAKMLLSRFRRKAFASMAQK